MDCIPETDLLKIKKTETISVFFIFIQTFS